MSMSWAFMAEGAVRRPSSRFIPLAAHRSEARSWSLICFSAKTRSLRRFCKASITVVSRLFDGWGNDICSCAEHETVAETVNTSAAAVLSMFFFINLSV